MNLTKRIQQAKAIDKLVKEIKVSRFDAEEALVNSQWDHRRAISYLHNHIRMA